MGVVQVVARSAKFSLFDPAKEMVYIEMSKEEKQQGKAAVDLVGSQVLCFGYLYLHRLCTGARPTCMDHRQAGRGQVVCPDLKVLNRTVHPLVRGQHMGPASC